MGLGTLWSGITTGNWGGTSKERKNFIHDTRTLRRREYQDMMYSMRKAGLNPILASGATPGHSAASMIPTQMANLAGVSSAGAAHRQAGVAEEKVPSEIGYNSARTAHEREKMFNTVYGRATLLQQYDMVKAQIKQVQQQTYNSALDAKLKTKAAEKLGVEIDNLKMGKEALRETGGYAPNLEGMMMKFLMPWANSAMDAARTGGERAWREANEPKD